MATHGRSLRVLLLLAVVLTGCAGMGSQALSFTTIDQGPSIRSADDGEREPTISVIASSDDVERFAQDVLHVDPQESSRGQSAVEQLRQLDYDRVFAILVTRGLIGSGGFDVSVQQIVRQDDVVRVQAKFTAPWWWQGRTPMSTEAYQLVAVNKEGVWGQPIRFELVVKGQVVAETTHTIP